MKKKIIFLLALGILVVPGMQAFASVGDCDNYDATLYSGVETTIAAQDNHTYSAAIHYSYGDLSYFQARLITDDKTNKCPYKDLYKGQNVTFTGVVNYPGQRILAKGIRYNINGAMQISGRFYYEGL